MVCTFQSNVIHIALSYSKDYLKLVPPSFLVSFFYCKKGKNINQCTLKTCKKASKYLIFRKKRERFIVSTISFNFLKDFLLPAFSFFIRQINGNWAACRIFELYFHNYSIKRLLNRNYIKRYLFRKNI